jgi:hypothetical protein
MSLYGVAAIGIAVLGAALAVCVKVAAGRKKRIEGLEKSLETAREEIRRLGEYYARKEEAQRNADRKKETLHTGDNVVDFDNSLKLLHGAAGGGKDTGPAS